MKLHALLPVLSALLVALMAVGCADDLRGGDVFGPSGEEVVMEFSVEKVALTRTDTDMESAIDHAWLLFYPIEETQENALPLAAVRAEVAEGDPSALSFRMPLRLEPDTDYRLLAIANADEYAPEGYDGFADWLRMWSSAPSDLREDLCLFHEDRILNETVAFLPMRGTVSDGGVFRFSRRNGSYSVASSLSFRRKVARIDVANMVRNGFVVEGVALCNWRDAVSAVADDVQSGKRVGTVRGILSNEGEDSSDAIFVPMPEADAGGVQQLQKSIYCFPSVCDDSFPSDTVSTALIIKARYGDDTEPTFYRVNVGTSGSKAEVKANTKYLVTIQSVKGRGEATARAAYMAEESSIVLSTVEDWDLEGSFAMDTDGNFIVLSTGRLEFEGASAENREIRVLVSPGLKWSVAYTPDNEESSAAFNALRISDSSLAIGPTGEDSEKKTLSGTFTVSADTPQGGTLSVGISVSMKATEEGPEQPDIPTDLPFALIPAGASRVKIDHDAKTIEIDAFDPDCFNSFIDVPFTLFINDDLVTDIEITVSCNMAWPSEGQVSKTPHRDYCYCSESFSDSGDNKLSVYSKSKGGLLSYLEIKVDPFKAKAGETVYLSVGAMAPDDPAIERTVSLIGYSVKTDYKLTVKPRTAIIDDVILSDGDSHWLILDRNVQNTDDYDFGSYASRKEGRKLQAYSYLNQYYPVVIPGKHKDAYGTPFNEAYHSLYKGLDVRFDRLSNLQSQMKAWLNGYVYSGDQTRTSPFYEAGNCLDWRLPDQELLDLCARKMKVAKMRMYLVSEVSVKSGKDMIPVCCYWPYHGDAMAGLSYFTNTRGYYWANHSGNPESMEFLYCDRTEVKTATPSISDKFYGLVRLVRPLTPDELETYKMDFLGYGTRPHCLTLCHPDTYESTPQGWGRF